MRVDLHRKPVDFPWKQGAGGLRWDHNHRLVGHFHNPKLAGKNMALPWVYHGFTMGLPWIYWAFTMDSRRIPMDLPGIVDVFDHFFSTRHPAGSSSGSAWSLLSERRGSDEGNPEIQVSIRNNTHR